MTQSTIGFWVFRKYLVKDEVNTMFLAASKIPWHTVKKSKRTEYIE
jgi:hypothetical protein